MDDFKQILLRKAKIITELKYPQRINREATLKYLKNVRKSEKQAQLSDIHIFTSLASLQLLSKQSIEKVYFVSFAGMKALNKKFQFIPQENDQYIDLVDMHYKFYIKQGLLEKAEQIRQAYRKNPLEKKAMLKKLINFLYEWGKRKLDKFLAKNISSIEKDIIADKLQFPKKFEQSSKKIKQTFPMKDLMSQGSAINVSYSEKLCKYQKRQDLKITIDENCNLQKQQKQNRKIQLDAWLSKFTTESQEQLNNGKEPISKRLQTSIDSEKNSQLEIGNAFIKQRSKSYKKQYPEKTIISPLNLNKEIFYGAYWKQMNQIYRNFNCLQDLDLYYLKTYKKQKHERKQEIKNRIEEIVQLTIKNMPGIKKSIDEYQNQYFKDCPIRIKKINTENSKLMDEQKKKKSLKQNSNYKNNQRRQSQQKQIVNYQNIKSQQNAIISKSSDITQKKNAILRARERNKSLNDPFMKKSTQQKVQMQLKLPNVYNPQQIYNIASYDTQKMTAIHQRLDKFVANGTRPNKGLVRYYHLNKQREKNTREGNDFLDGKLVFHQSSSKDTQKQHQYEVANIRKILRKRQKERLYVNKTPTYQTSKQDEIMDKIMIHIKAMQTRFENQISSSKKSDKFDIFIKNLKNTSISAFNVKGNSKSFHIGCLKSNNSQYHSSELKSLKDDFLPKIS